MDHFGWGGSWDAIKDVQGKVVSNWNWDFFRQYLTYSLVTITVKNNGDGTAYVKYDVVYPNGEKHFQYYTGIPIDDIADLQISIVPECSYMVFFE